MRAPYGSWASPIDTTLITSGTIRPGCPVASDQRILWSESRPSEGGRTVIVERLPDGSRRDRIPEGFNVRSRVHEYGGGAWASSGETLYFVNDADQRIYTQQGHNPPQALTGSGSLRYADLQPSPTGKTLVAIQEAPADNGAEPDNRLVMLSTATGGGAPTVIAEGEDFYASPRYAQDGRRLAWLSWNHPDMPWDHTRLWVADILSDGRLSTPTIIAGTDRESIFQPQWAANGDLYFVSDRSGWWNLYVWSVGDEPRPLLPMAAEFGLPQWVFGQSTYAVTDDGRLLCSYSQSSTKHLGILDPQSGHWQPLDLPYSEFSDLHAHAGQALMIAASPQQPPAVISLKLRSIDQAPGDAIQVLCRSMAQTPAPGYLSVPQSIDYPSEGGEIAHALYYPPCNQDFEPINGEKPPLLVRSHGGPTAAASTAFDPAIQYWTSRGFALLDVNYGGSTGYGRAYRERLDGRWGITDVDDCIHGARHLIEQGLADPQRCAIRGSSAGGYTTLAALTFRNLFKAGASLYGISDLEALVSDTHKFESRYLDRLIGPYPERRDVYYQRSPIHFVEQLSCPMIIFQGLQDKVVPPSQAEAMVEALRSNGIPVTYRSFANEGHGFRDAATIKTVLEEELAFYAHSFGFPLPK